MRRFFTPIVVAMLWLAAGTSPGTALENLRVFRGVLILEGKIESGDYLSVRNFLRDESNFKKISGGVFLASPGGSVLEALKIGRLIRELRLSTEAPASPPAVPARVFFFTSRVSTGRLIGLAGLASMNREWSKYVKV
jgi:hypothetical protein